MPTSLEQLLRQLPAVGLLVKDRGYRQVWRFEHDQRAYYLKFYPRGGARDSFRRFFRGSPAMREFLRLQWLQKAAVPAPRATAVMMGFRIGDKTGDAVILEAIEPGVALDQYLLSVQAQGRAAPDHRSLVNQVIEIVSQLARASLGHHDLHLGNFLLSNGKLFLLDAYAVRSGGLKLNDLLMLGHSAARFATTTDLLRGWYQLGPGSPLPTVNSFSAFLWKRFMQSTSRDNRYFGRLAIGDWSGVFCKRSRYPHRWAIASELDISPKDWEREWPLILEQIQSGQMAVLKRSRSGEVLDGKCQLGGRELDIIIKRPRRRYWYRYVNEIGRGSRPWRAWKKAWQIIARGIPTAWPLAVMERRRFGYVVDAVFICERVAGPTLASSPLDELPAGLRENLFRRAGHLLRAIERFGFAHFDAKPSNWIVRSDPVTGPTPVLIDIDGIRHRRWELLGLHRLLRGMRENPQYTPLDSLALCRGYAPYARSEDLKMAAPADQQS